MVTRRIRRPVYDAYGRIVSAVNDDEDMGPGNARTARINGSSAAPIGHMNPGKGLKGITQVQQAGLGDLKDSRFNGPIAPSK